MYIGRKVRGVVPTLNQFEHISLKCLGKCLLKPKMTPRFGPNLFNDPLRPYKAARAKRS